MDLFRRLPGRAGRGLLTGLAIGAQKRLAASVQERPPFSAAVADCVQARFSSVRTAYTSGRGGGGIYIGLVQVPIATKP